MTRGNEMDDSNSAVATAESVAPFGLPRITIPPDRQTDEFGRVRFQIETADGSVSVEAYLWSFYCRGSAKALQAAGIVRKEWLPGEPGNNAVKQTVTWGPDGPQLMLGRYWKIKRHERRVNITRVSRDKYQVTVPTTPEQKIYLNGIEEQQTKARREAEQREARESVRKETEPQSAGAFRARKLKLLDMWESIAEVAVRTNGRYGYTSEAEGQIRAAAAELRRAIAEGAVIERQERVRVGNVLYLNTP